jgi:hypothetical protein
MLKAKLWSVTAATVALSLLTAAAAQAEIVPVSSTGSIWLAGQPAGVSVTGDFGTDTAPQQSPFALTITASTVTFAATGVYTVNPGGCYNATPAGGCYSNQADFTPSPWNADYQGPDALVGIFLNSADTPVIGGDGSNPSDGYMGPLNYVPGPDYTDPSNTGPGTYSPVLDQIFYIGTGDGETFNVPTGADQLFLAVEDSLGGNANNLGYVIVDVTGASGVPETASWVTMVVGIGALGAYARRRRVLLAA